MLMRILVLAAVLLTPSVLCSQIVVADFDYELFNLDGSPVGQVDLPGGESAFRIYNEQNYLLRLSVEHGGLQNDWWIWAAGARVAPFGTDGITVDFFNQNPSYAPGWTASDQSGVWVAQTPSGGPNTIQFGDREMIFEVEAQSPDAGALEQGEFGTLNVGAVIRVSGQDQPLAPNNIQVELSNYAASDTWQNQANNVDVNGDSAVSPIDALLVINNLDSDNSMVPFEQPTAGLLIDVDGDGSISPTDALAVISALPTN